jgi:uncharacterized membrane protein
MKSWIIRHKEKPIYLIIYGWLLFPSMYLLVGILSSLHMQVVLAFAISAPLGIIGFIFWVIGVFFSFKSLLKKQAIVVSTVAFLIGMLPIAFLGYVFWLSANGF